MGLVPAAILTQKDAISAYMRERRHNPVEGLSDRARDTPFAKVRAGRHLPQRDTMETAGVPPEQLHLLSVLFTAVGHR